MLILIEIDNGESWEDYRKWAHKIYDMPLNESPESLHRKYKQYIIDKMLEQNITINHHYLNIMNHSKCKDQKKHKKIMRECGSLCDWIEKTYNVKSLEFETIHDYNHKKI